MTSIAADNQRQIRVVRVLWGIVGMLIGALLFLGALAFLGSGIARDWREMPKIVDEGGDKSPPRPPDCTYVGTGWECGS